jgi:hypothetical protein
MPTTSASVHNRPPVALSGTLAIRVDFSENCHRDVPNGSAFSTAVLVPSAVNNGGGHYMNTTQPHFLTAAVTDAGAQARAGFEKRTLDKVTWRLLPFLIVCYFIAVLDRVNVGFANATMSKDLALSAAAFGGAAGIFFVGYFFFEVPSVSGGEVQYIFWRRIGGLAICH